MNATWKKNVLEMHLPEFMRSNKTTHFNQDGAPFHAMHQQEKGPTLLNYSVVEWITP